MSPLNMATVAEAISTHAELKAWLRIRDHRAKCETCHGETRCAYGERLRSEAEAIGRVTRDIRLGRVVP